MPDQVRNSSRDACAAVLFRLGKALKDGWRPAGRDVVAARMIIEGLSEPSEHPMDLRRRLLRRVWRDFFPGYCRCPAAQLIATRWSLFADNWKEDYAAVPDTIEAVFDRLVRAGVRPVSGATILNDLDDSQDRHRAFSAF